MSEHPQKSSNNHTNKDPWGYSEEELTVAFKEAAAMVRQADRNAEKHIADVIYGFDADISLKLPFVNSSFPGGGKTYQLVKFLSENYRGTVGRKLVICFKEVRLLCEFAIALRDEVKSKSSSDYTNLSRYIRYVFSPSDEVIREEQTKLAENPGNRMMRRILRFLGSCRANGVTAKLDKDCLISLRDAQVILTTHASSDNLAAAGVLKGASVIFDEAPNLFSYVDLNQHNSDVAHKAMYRYCVDTCDENLADARRIGRLVSLNVWKYSPTFTLNTEQIVSLHGADAKLKANSVTGFYVAYRDFFAGAPLDVLILTACPRGTDLTLFQALDKVLWPSAESDNSQSWRARVNSRIRFVPVGSHTPATKKTASADEGKVARKKLLNTLPPNSFVVAHRWNSACKFPVCKLCEAGSNSFASFCTVGILNLFRQDPLTRVRQDLIFGPAADYIRRMQSANMLGQSIMRSNLRVHDSKTQVKIFYFDEWTYAYWLYFAGAPLYDGAFAGLFSPSA